MFVSIKKTPAWMEFSYWPVKIIHFFLEPLVLKNSRASLSRKCGNVISTRMQSFRIQFPVVLRLSRMKHKFSVFFFKLFWKVRYRLVSPDSHVLRVLSKSMNVIWKCSIFYVVRVSTLYDSIDFAMRHELILVYFGSCGNNGKLFYYINILFRMDFLPPNSTDKMPY